MGESEMMLPLLAIGGLAIGAVVLLPSIMKGSKEEDIGGGMGPIESQGWDALDRELEARRKLEELRRLKEREEIGLYPPDRDRVPLLIGKPEDDTYLITDEDFSKLDIGKKDRRWLNAQRKLKDARLERVVYGDTTMPALQSYFTNTVNPYGQGPSPEFIRLGRPQDLSSTNTKSNTINLY